MYKWTFEQQTVLGENTGLADVEMSNRVSKSRKYQICKIPSKFGDFNKKPARSGWTIAYQRDRGHYWQKAFLTFSTGFFPYGLRQQIWILRQRDNRCLEMQIWYSDRV